MTNICSIIPLSYSITLLFTWAIKQIEKIIGTGDVYSDCFMYFQPRISFQPRVVLKREQGIFCVWGDMKQSPLDEMFFVCTDIYVQCAADAGGSFLQTNTESVPNYLLLFQKCYRKFQPRLTCFSTIFVEVFSLTEMFHIQKFLVNRYGKLKQKPYLSLALEKMCTINQTHL